MNDGRTLPDPASRGALIFSAAQDYQSASEDVELVDGTSVPHGAFSLALFRVLRASRSDEPAERLARSVRALLQSEGGAQAPALEGQVERLGGALIGSGRAAGEEALAIPVLRVVGEALLDLQAGPALGVAKGTVLVAEKATGPDALRVEVTAILGMARARARVLNGTTATLRPGLSRFVVSRWVPAGGAPLKLLAPELELEALAALEPELRRLRASPRIEWVVEPTDHPTHIVSFSGETWRLSPGAGAPVDLGRRLTADAVLDALPPALRARLWVVLPVPPSLRRSLEGTLGERGAAVALVTEPDRAHYVLTGRAADGAPGPDGRAPAEYALVQADLTLPCGAPGGPPDLCRPGGTLPAATRWVGEAEAPRELAALAQRLARIRGWLTIEGGVARDFPYALALRSAGGGPVLHGGTLRAEERYDVLLRARPEELARAVLPRFVYVFVLGSDGSTSLVFPSSSSCDVEARVPVRTAGGLDLSPELTLRTIRVGPPFGQDTYLMLSTEEALPGCALLEGQGVAAAQRGASQGRPPLEALLLELGRGTTRGAAEPVPQNWSIERLVFTSAPALTP